MYLPRIEASGKFQITTALCRKVFPKSPRHLLHAEGMPYHTRMLLDNARTLKPANLHAGKLVSGLSVA